MGLTDFFIPIIGSGIEIGLLAVGILLSIAAGVLVQGALPRNPITRKNTTIVTAERGSWIPFIRGTMRVGHVFAWIGVPNTQYSKNGFLVTVKQKHVSQPGWHILCVGPGTKLIKIYQQGKVIYPLLLTAQEQKEFSAPSRQQTELNAATTPSGSLIGCANSQGRFKIFWGDPANPPPDTIAHPVVPNFFINAVNPGSIKSGMGIGDQDHQPKFPNVFSILWCNKGLQQAFTWPELTYEIEVRPYQTFLTNNPPPYTDPLKHDWVDGSAGPTKNLLVPFPPATVNNGADPINCIAEIMCSPYPRGVGIPVANLDLTFFEAMQGKLAHETGANGCRMASNIIAQNGDTAGKTIQDILFDIGGVIPQVGDKIVIYLIRQESSCPVLSDDALVPPLPELSFVQGPRPVNRVTYLYKDRLYAMRDNDITIDDDSDQSVPQKPTQTPLNSIIDHDVALLATDRKQIEGLIDVRTFKVTGNRQARTLSPGQIFQITLFGVVNQLRISSVQRPENSSTIVLECVTDPYTPIAGAGHSTAHNNFGSGINQPDAQLYAWIIPYDLMPHGANFGDAWVQFMPIKANSTTHNNDIQVTFDTGGSPIFNYIQTNENFFIQGLLTADWDWQLPLTSKSAVVEINIECNTLVDENGVAVAAEDLDFDVSNFPDLTNYPERWRNGENCCAIEDQSGKFVEVIYFMSITPSTNAHCYLLNGILRHRMIKILDPYAEYSGRVVLFRRADLNPILLPNPTVGAFWSPTNTMTAKSFAVNSNGDTQLLAGNAVITRQVFASFAPLPPANFRSADADLLYSRFTFQYTADCVFKWTNRPLIHGIGTIAGTQLAGVVCSPVPVPFEGTLFIRIYTDSGLATLKRTITVAQGSKKIYNALQLFADFGFIAPGSTFYVTYQVNVNGITGPAFGQLFTARA